MYLPRAASIVASWLPTNPSCCGFGHVPHPRIAGRLAHGRFEVAAGVVADDHLEVGERLPEHAGQRLPEEGAVPVGRHADRHQRRGRGHRTANPLALC